MKLLFVHQHLGEFGGAEINIKLAAKELHARGHTAALLYCQATGRNESRWREIFTKCFCLPTRGNLEVVEAVLDQFEPDLIYLHNITDLEVLKALLDSHLPVVRMVHDHAMYCMRGYKYNYFTRQVCTRAFSPYCVFPCLASLGRNHARGLPFKWVSYGEKRREIELNQRCERLVVYSEYLKQELVGNGFNPAKIEICVPIRSGRNQEQVSSFSDRNLILFAGQLIRGKGVDVLLQALAKVKTHFECVILGEGSHRGHCEKLCKRLGLKERVKFQGYVLPAELKHFYLQASVFVMASLWPEPFGMAGPEAMRYGLPVVAFNAGGIREWLQDGQNGYLVDWGNTDLFAQRVDALLSDKELARAMGKRALQSVKRFDATLQVRKLEDLFQRVVHPTRENLTPSPLEQPICL